MKTTRQKTNLPTPEAYTNLQSAMATKAPRATCTLMAFLFPLLASTCGDDGIRFVYNGFQRANLILKGIAQVHPNGLLQLTNNSQHKVGFAFHPKPIKFDKHLSFSVVFAFSIHPDIPNHGSQGMTFVLSPSMNFDHALPDEFLGLFNSTSNGLASNHIFAIELDTIQNAHFDDIDGNHVGIDADSLTSAAAASAAYYTKEGKKESLLLSSSKPMLIWVDYDELTMLVNVTMAPIKTPKPTRSLLSTKINLTGLILDTMYIGFSAATGLTANDHYVLGWSWSQSGQAQGLDPSRLPSLPKSGTSKRRPDRTFLSFLISVSILSAAILVTAYIMRQRKYEEVREGWEKEYAPYRFCYKDLYKSTKGFKSTELLGEGGYGSVYKGVLSTSDNLHIAVKRVSHGSGQGMKEFVAEIVSMRRLRHRNLVQLFGYCRRKGELLLVYDYMPNGSLDKYLIGDGNPVLGWHERFKIIKGVASALVYLHEEWEQVVLHRDVKASNVLLDAHMNARLGDFGLARLYDHGTNPRTTHVVGTVGYLAPEFVRTGKATTSCDVFAYGAFVLEVGCGRSPLEMERVDREDEEDLVEWVSSLHKRGSILDASDPKLEGNYDPKAMEMVLKIGLLCSHLKPETRPSMRQVVQLLNGAALLPEIPPDFNEGETSSPFPTSAFRMDFSGSLDSTDSIIQSGR